MLSVRRKACCVVLKAKTHPMKPCKTYLLVFLAFVTLATLSFRAHGQPLTQAWLQRYGAPGTSSAAVAMTLDANGNVFVTGSSTEGTNVHYLTLGYSNVGVPLWTNYYGGPGDLSAAPNAIATDQGGNVFVTGSSFLPAIPRLAPTDYGYATLAYSGNGVPLWTNTYSVSGRDRAGSVAVDQNGNVFVTGSSAESTNAHPNMTTIAYSGSGLPLWTNRYKGAGLGGSSGGDATAVDSNGSIFVAGASYGSDGYQHYALVAYSNAGVPLWTNQYIGPTTSGDGASAVAVDSSGNVFVTGLSYNTSGFYDYLTLAYSGAGVPLWTNRYGTASASMPSAITVASSGSVFVTGQSWSGIGPQYATVAYSGSGLPLWTNRYDGPIPGTASATAVAADGQGNVFVTGSSSGTSSNYDYLTLGYASSGAPFWTNAYNGPANGSDQARAIAVDHSGNVFVTGRSWNGTNYDFVTIKYSVVQRPPILIEQMGQQIVLSWTNSLFHLQTAPTLSDTFTNIPGATSPYTNTMNRAQQFFRLSL
jgi:hypothetical protein